MSDSDFRIPFLTQLKFPGATYCLFWSTAEDDKHLTIIFRVAREKAKLFLAEIS